MKQKRVALIFAVLVALILLPEVRRFAARAVADHRVLGVALADLDGDGSLDAFLANGGGSAVHPAYVLINDGAGHFGHDVRALAQWPGDSATLGDLDGDGFDDILLGLSGGAIVRYLNDGSGHFPRWTFLVEPAPLGVMRVRPVLGDLNSNGTLDIFAAGCCGREAELVPDGSNPLLSYSEVWLYDARGSLRESYRVGEAGSNAAALADLNGDGSLDVFLANGRTLNRAGETDPNTPNTILFNDGGGHLADSGQKLGRMESTAVALGDLNGDGVADAAVGNRGPDEIWLNDGRGFFADSGQRLGDTPTGYIYLVDLNGDAQLDLVGLGAGRGGVWLNDGTGHFSSGQQIRYGRQAIPAVGDLTGDGLVDLFVVDEVAYRVWRGQGNGRFLAQPVRRYR